MAENSPSPKKNQPPDNPSFPLYIMTGGVGASGEQLARTVLAQFPKSEVPIKLFPRIFTRERVEQILNQAQAEDAVVAHTFVNPVLRQGVNKIADQLGVEAIDLVGDLMDDLAVRLDLQPRGEPGLYRRLHKSDFERWRAMDFGLTHDDGKNPQGWPLAEIIILGASRVGKTPLSMYLSVLGWKVANVPLVAGIPPRAGLFELTTPFLVGLTVAPSELIEHRRHRQSTLGVGATKSDYVDPLKVYEEIETIERMYKRHRIPIIDVTGKPVESSADEIIRRVQRERKSNAT
jgi:[pyruvate, water dikinase]-phosphate phosphotransferase / [pyruvate, water dikinase] kinase